MITLITGTPGAGKTLYAVHEILNEEGKGSRPIYVDGIPELKTRHEPAPDLYDWETWAPEGALIVVDEAQRIWRPQPSGSKVPASIAAMETHRHRGIDFVLITQHPNLIHANIRKLVGRHIHLRRTALGTYIHEWPETANPEARTNSIRIRWKHPKESYGLYKSASLHTKVKHRMPTAVYVFGTAVVILLVGVIYMTHNIGTKAGLLGEPNDEKPGGSISQSAKSNAQGDTQDATYYDTGIISEPMHPVIAFIPRYQDDPASAPAYDGMRQVVDYPRVNLCIASRSRCICYSQQQTRMDISDELCRRYAAGLVFDPYRETQNTREPKEYPTNKTSELNQEKET